jgi:N-acyl-phosphatidylethanolamine-hydrolysing phospholipase D
MLVGSIRNGAKHLVRADKVKGRYVSPFEQPYLDLPLLEHVNVWRARRKMGPLKFKNGIDPNTLIKVQKVNKESLTRNDVPHFTWMGHASCYYQSDGIRFITDPVFSKRCSPSQLIGPKRVVPTPCCIEDIPIDVVLISHTHYDHLDYHTVKKIGNKPLWIVPLGVKSWLEKKCNIDNVIELNWWDSINLSPPEEADSSLSNSSSSNASSSNTLTTSSTPSSTAPSSTSSSVNTSSSFNTLSNITTVTMTPAKHWTKRTFLDQNKCLWGGFAVKSKSSSWYFSGDTAWDDQLFKTIGEQLGPFNLASIGIGCYTPREVMSDSHTSPSEALDIFQQVGAEKMMGMHWGTFKLADEANVEPAFDLGIAREDRDLEHDQVFTMGMGETLELTDNFMFGESDVVHNNPELYNEFKAMNRSEKKVLTTSLIDSPHYSISF